MDIMLYLGNGYPESINRVQDLTGRKVAFHEADLCNKDSLRKVTHKELFQQQRTLDFFLYKSTVLPSLHVLKAYFILFKCSKKPCCASMNIDISFIIILHKSHSQMFLEDDFFYLRYFLNTAVEGEELTVLFTLLH